MKPLTCFALEDYLARAMTPTEQASFLIHAVVCSECSQAIQDAEALAHRLCCAVDQENPVPEGLNLRIRQELSWRSRRRVVTALGSVAALIAVFVGVLGQLPPPRAPVPSVQVKPPLEVAVGPEVPSPTQVELDSDSAALAVRLPTSSPRVTVVWIYPTIDLNRSDQ